jgi:anti-anti-sigma factor
MSTDDHQGEARTVADTKNLTVSGESSGGVMVASVSGRVDGSNAQEFQEALETLLSDGSAALVLDLESLAYISSAGLRVILLISRQMQGRSGKFGVCGLTGAINEVFALSGFDKIIPIHASRSDALSALGG